MPSHRVLWACARAAQTVWLGIIFFGKAESDFSTVKISLTVLIGASGGELRSLGVPYI